jgi:hypothetical protein
MGRATRQRRIDAQERWPDLYQFLAAHPHRDWPDDSRTPEAAVDLAISEHGLEQRQSIARQWWDWNAVEGSDADPRPAINDGLGVEVSFDTPREGREFMNSVYDKLIVSIRQEVKDWKP